MIRRIVDSVSLLSDADREQTDLSLLSCSGSSSALVGNSNDSKITLRNRSASSTESSDSVDINYTNLFTPYGPLTTISSSGSCYIAQKSESKVYPHASDDERVKISRSPSAITARRQSPSPGGVDPSCVASRQLPGGPLLQQRVQRTQPIRKKEHGKCVGSATKLSKSTRAIKNFKSEEVASANEENHSEFTGTASQVDPLAMSVECYVLPFLQDLKAIELRIPEENFSKAQRRILKTVSISLVLFISPNFISDCQINIVMHYSVFHLSVLWSTNVLFLQISPFPVDAVRCTFSDYRVFQFERFCH